MVKPAEIPAAFRRFDARVTDPDQCLNVRDLKTWYDNFNILMARRVRQPVFTMALARDADNIGASGQTGEFVGQQFRSPYAITRAPPFPNPIINTLVQLPPYCQYCTLAIRAKESATTDDCVLYPVIGDQEPSTAETITVTSTSMAKYTVDIRVPTSGDGTQGLADGFFNNRLVFRLFATTPVSTSLSLTNEAIHASGPNWVEVTNAPNVGDMVHITDNTTPTPVQRTDIRPKLVTETVDVGSTYYVYVDGSWEAPIHADVDAGDHLNGRSINVLTMASITLSPKSVSDPFAEIL